MKSPNTSTAQGASSKACSLSAGDSNSLIENVSRETKSTLIESTNAMLREAARGWGQFRLGELVITPAAQEVLKKNRVFSFELIGQHVHGDFGDLCDEDKTANIVAIEAGDRIRSIYRLGNDKVWVITTADRSVTAILLPSDY